MDNTYYDQKSTKPIRESSTVHYGVNNKGCHCGTAVATISLSGNKIPLYLARKDTYAGVTVDGNDIIKTRNSSGWCTDNGLINWVDEVLVKYTAKFHVY